MINLAIGRAASCFEDEAQNARSHFSQGKSPEFSSIDSSVMPRAPRPERAEDVRKPTGRVTSPAREEETRIATLLSLTSIGIGDLDVFLPSPPCLLVYTRRTPTVSPPVRSRISGRMRRPAPSIMSSSIRSQRPSRLRWPGRKRTRRRGASSASMSNTSAGKRSSGENREPRLRRRRAVPRRCGRGKSRDTGRVSLASA